MRNLYLLTFILISVSLSHTALAQNFQYTSPVTCNTVANAVNNLSIVVPNAQPAAGTATIEFFAAGDLDFGAPSEYFEFFDPNGNSLGTIGGPPAGQCTGFTSFVITRPASVVNTWIVNNSITFSVVSGTGLAFGLGCTPNVDQNCVYVDIEYLSVFNNIGMNELYEPQEAICGPSSAVEVDFLNNGITVMNSAQLNWQVRPFQGVPQTVNSYQWNGSLQPGQVSPRINIGNYTAGFNAFDTIVVFTSLPNGVQDSSNFNDTLKRVIYQGIRGEYTVGGTFPDFRDVAAAANFIDSIGAVCDSVVFTIRDGDYYGRFDIGHILNTDFIRPIIFRSESGNPANCRIIDSTASTQFNNYVARLSGVDHIIFDGVSIINQSNSPLYQMAVRVTAESMHPRFYNCNFESNFTGTNTNINASLIYADSSSDQGSFVFDNCQFEKGAYGLNWLGFRAAQPNMNSVISNCSFTNQRFIGVRVVNQENFTFSGNEITASDTSLITNTTGFEGTRISGGFTFSDNQVIAQTNFPRRGVRLLSSINRPGRKGLFTNNLVVVGEDSSSTSVFATEISRSVFVDGFHNTFVARGTNLSSYAFRIDRGGANRFLNNNVVSLGQGYALSFNTSGGIFPLLDANHNNLFSFGPELVNNDGTDEANLLNWQLSRGFDANSVSANPLFYSDTDYHVCAEELDNAGIPVGVASDFDGQPRSASTPDIGVDEFNSHTNYRVSPDVVICKGDSFLVDASLNLNATITWDDGFADALRWISDAKTYVVSSSGNCGSATDTFTVSFSTADVLGADTSICRGDQAAITVNAPTSAIFWNDGTSANPKIVSNTGLYIVSIVDSLGCQVSDSIRVITSIPVTLPNDTSFCEGNSIFLTGRAGSGTYSWNTGQSSSSILVDSTANYVLTHTSPIGCVSSDSTFVEIIPAPNADFTSQEVLGTMQFTNTSTGGNSFSWDFGDGGSSTLENPNYVYGPAGNYNVTLTVFGPCGQDFTTQTVTVAQSGNPIGIQNVNEQDDFAVFPNPSSGNLTLTHNLDKVQRIEVSDMLGKTVFGLPITNQENTINLNLSHLDKGNYLVTIITDSNRFIQKIQLH